MAESRPLAALSPDAVAATLKVALAQHQRGALAVANALYDQVLLLDADNADALHLKGLIALANGAAANALALLETSCRLAPSSALFHRSRGDALAALGRWPEACAAFECAVAIKPDWADAHASLGMGFAAIGDTGRAKTSLIAATKLSPEHGDSWTNLGILHLADKDHDAALTAFTTAVTALSHELRTGTSLVRALNGLGVAQTETGDLAGALATFTRALGGSTDSIDAADVRMNRAVALQKAERWTDALNDLRIASAASPARAEIWRTMSKSLVALGAIAEAEAACSRAVALNPSVTASHYERSFVRLLAGDLAGGFDDYRYRPTVDRARIAIPESVLPTDLCGRRFRLVLEQGLGEHLFFLRYAPILAARGALLKIEADGKLLPVLRSAFPGDLINRDAATSGTEPIYIGDLPFLTGASHAPPSLTLSPDPALRDEIAARLAAFGPPPYVALTWRAGIRDGKSLSKVVPIDAYAAGVKTARATLVSIQRAPLAGETAHLSALIGRPILDFSTLNDDLAAMLAFHSLVADYVGVSNTNMHLRAALGLPARVLVPHPPEFRWMATGERSPWFPTFTVYRASPTWDDAIARLTCDLPAI